METKTMPKKNDSVQDKHSHSQWRPWRCFKKKRFCIPCVIAIILVAYLTWDYHGPRTIPFESDTAWGLTCKRAEDLVVQDIDSEGHLWATRGMWAYRLQSKDNKFVRQQHIPTGFSLHWLRNFSFVRYMTTRDECVDLFPIPGGKLCAMSGGRMWFSRSLGDDFEESMALRHYGAGVGRGIFKGFTRLKNGTLFIGEYFNNGGPISNRDRTNVRVYASKDNGATWHVAHEFPPRQIRHVHSIQQDPYTGKVWICTGDFNEESMIAWTTDDFKTLNEIGKGSQIWRTCQLAFSQDSLFWGTDTSDRDAAGIYAWDKETHKLSKLSYLPGFIFSATELAGGTIVLGMNRQGTRPFEENDKTWLYVISKNNTVTAIPCGTHANRKRFADLRFQRSQGTPSLYLTCLNQKEYNGDLFMFAEKEFRDNQTHSSDSSLQPGSH